MWGHMSIIPAWGRTGSSRPAWAILQHHISKKPTNKNRNKSDMFHQLKNIQWALPDLRNEVEDPYMVKSLQVLDFVRLPSFLLHYFPCSHLFWQHWSLPRNLLSLPTLNTQLSQRSKRRNLWVNSACRKLRGPSMMAHTYNPGTLGD